MESPQIMIMWRDWAIKHPHNTPQGDDIITRRMRGIVSQALEQAKNITWKQSVYGAQ